MYCFIKTLIQDLKFFDCIHKTNLSIFKIDTVKCITLCSIVINLFVGYSAVNYCNLRQSVI